MSEAAHNASPNPDMTDDVPTWVPWPQDVADDAALAAGEVLSAEVAHWQQQAQRIEHLYQGRQLVLHRWTAAQRNGAAPVVLLHGGSGSWTHWVRSIGPLLAQGHDVWAVDLPGFGASQTVPGVHDGDTIPPVLADALSALLPQQRVQLVGFSFGGMTAGIFAAAYPQHVEQLVLVGAPGMGLKSEHPRLKGWRHLPTYREQIAHHVYNLGVLMVADSSTIDRDMVALHIANVRRDRMARRRISSTDVLVQALHRVKCPVTAIYGAGDVLYPEGLLDEAEALMVGAVAQFGGLHRVAGIGHWVQYEAREAFHAVLLPQLAPKHAAL